jgi:hypothetical protein
VPTLTERSQAEDPEPVEFDADAVMSDKSRPDPNADVGSDPPAGADKSTPESVLLPRRRHM